MVVLLILGILAGVTYPRFSQIVEQYQLNTAARALVGEIRLLQQRAVSGESTRVKIIFDADCYYICQGMIVERKVSLPGGIYFSSIPFAGNTVSFKYSGSPTTAGTLILQSRKGASSLSIIIMPATGRVRLE